MIEKTKQNIEHLKNLLKIEKNEDLNQYNQYIISIALTERQRKGSAWYPSDVKETGFGMGDRPFVIVERSKDKDQPHQFSSGKQVSVFSQIPGVEKPESKGIVNFVRNNRMKIIFNAPDLPDWIHEGKVGVNLLFDDRTYREMEKALNLLEEAKRNRLAIIRDILLGEREPLFHFSSKPFFSNTLNDSQNEALNKAIAAEDIAVIHGPPGTGKTTTLVQTIKFITQEKQSILATAPSNAAVDLLTLKLAETGLNVVRVGNISRLSEGILDYTLEGKLFNLPESKEIKKMKREVLDLRSKAQKFKRKFGFEQREERRSLYREARELSNQILIIENYLVNKIIDEADVVTSTLVGASDKYLMTKFFDVVVIDEAAQALEPATWIPITKGSKVILAGDPFQLPPTVKSPKAERGGLSETLMEKTIKKLPKVSSLLKVQYRMNETIMGFSNLWFYNNELKADDFVKNWGLTLNDGTSQVLEFIDTAGCGFEEKKNPKTRSLFNPEEYTVMWRHLDNLLALLDKNNLPTFGIISPYKEQVLYIKQQIASYFDFIDNSKFDINTIDSFQGQERDVIYISLVRSNEKNEIGFLKDYRRMNVAMTRARKKLIVIGDSATLGGHDFYEAFLDYCNEKNAYSSAWEYM